MRQNLSYLFILLFFPLVLLAQKNGAKSATITLNPDKLAKNKYIFPEKIAGIRVIPILWDSIRVGTVQKGMMNAIRDAVPDKPWQQWLQEYVDGHYRGSFDHQGDSLLWIIKDLAVNEQTFSMSEKAYIRFAAESWKEKDSKYYKIADVDTSIMTGGGMDATGKHPQNIANQLQVLLEKGFAHVDNSTDSLRSVDEIVAITQKRQEIPLFSVDSIPDGVYMTFEDVKNANPSMTQYVVRNDIKEHYLNIWAYNSPTDSILLMHPWGVVRNGELYMNYQDQYLLPLTIEHHSLILSSANTIRKHQNSSMIWGAALGGIVGAVIMTNGFNSGDENNIVPQNFLPYAMIPNVKDSQLPKASCVNMENGKLTF